MQTVDLKKYIFSFSRVSTILNIGIIIFAAIMFLLGIWEVIDLDHDVVWKLFLTWLVVFISSYVVIYMLKHLDKNTKDD